MNNINNMNNLLSFGKGNAKLDKTILTFSLPAGKTCPFAKDCKAEVKNGKISVGKDAKYRCFAATSEVAFPSVLKSRTNNLKLLLNAKTTYAMFELIKQSLIKKKFDKVRIHVSGDFFSEDYLKAWIEVANYFSDKIFYAYTKSVRYVLKQRNNIPKNLVITCSLGGIDDTLVIKNKLKRVKVYFHPDEAEKDGNKIDHDDSLAIDPNVEEFGLLLHGIQAKGTNAAKALSRMRSENIDYSYHKK